MWRSRYCLAMGFWLILSAQVQAESLSICPIDIHQELHLDGSKVTIIDSKGSVAEFEDDGLTIQGEPVALSEEQEKVLNEYREHLNEYVPQAKEIALSGVDLANEIIDELSVSFDNTDAFENIRQAVNDFYKKIEQRYYQGGEMVIPPDAFEDVYQNWQQDFAQAKEIFNREFISSAFTAVQEKMQSEEGINFTALQEEIMKLQASVESKLTENTKQIQKQAEAYCDSMQSLAEQEKSVVDTIPELKHYQLFEI